MKSILGGIPLMKKQDLIDYIKNTPENLNMAILLQMVDDAVENGWDEEEDEGGDEEEKYDAM